MYHTVCHTDRGNVLRGFKRTSYMCKNHAIAPNFMGTVCRYKSVEGGAREKLKSSDRVKTTGGSVVIREPSTMDDPANYTCSFAVSDADGASLEATIQLIGQSADG